MRKIIVSMNITLDGFMSGKGCELDWHFRYWSSEMAQELAMQLSKADSILLGRKTFDAMAAHWPLKALDPCIARDDVPFVEMMNRHEKIVFSNTITNTHWQNSRVISGNLSSQTIKLKSMTGRNIIIYGSGQLVRELCNQNLVDEFQLWIHPILLGKGRSLFKDRAFQQTLELTEMKQFDSGVVVLFHRMQPSC